MMWWYIPFPELREFSEKELKAWVRANDERIENGEKPRERTMFHESYLQIAVYDETDGGGKGACLGVLRWGEDEMVSFLTVLRPMRHGIPWARTIERKTLTMELNTLP